MASITSIIKKYCRRFVPKSLYQKKSFSQCGEDLILVNLLNRVCGGKRIKYLDIGANHPFSLSNTALFYLRNNPRGGGVLIEPNPELAKLLKDRRNKDTVLNVGISSGRSSQKMRFYIIDAHVLSTFSREEAKQCENMGHKIVGVINVKTIPINNILKKYFPNGKIDLMNLDTEGYDLKILKTINYTLYKPKVICVETVDYKPQGQQTKQEDILNFLLKKGYKVYGETGINTIFIRTDL